MLGESKIGTIATPSQELVYFYDLMASDLITLQLSDSGLLDAEFELFRPDGTLEVNGSGSNFVNIFLDNYEVSQTGTYGLLVRDEGRNETGDVNITVQRTNLPVNAIVMDYGDSVTGSIDVASDLDAFTFDGTAGDLVTLQLSDPGLLDAEFRIYRPDGTFEQAVSGSNFDNAFLDNYEIDQTGSYTILVRDNGGNETGEYDVSLQRTNPPEVSTLLTYGDSVTGSIDVASDLDAFTFDGTAGDLVTLQLSDPGLLDAEFRIYRPDGTFEQAVSGSNFDNAFLDNYEIDQTGSYTILVRDNGGNETGEYDVSLQRTNPPEVSTLLTYGDSVTGSIDVASDLDAFTFDGTAGDLVTLQLSDPGLLDAEFRIYRPDGTFEQAVSGSNFDNAFLDNYEIDQTGSYTILVRDNGGNETGSYTLSLDSIFTAPPSNSPPTLANPIADQMAVVGESFAFNFGDNTFQDVDDGLDPNHMLTFSAILVGGAGLPPWLNFDSITQTFQGTPTPNDLGTLSVQVTATDNFGESATDVFELEIKEINEPDTGTDDLLRGTPEDDVLDARSGNDVVYGSWGDDLLEGGAGDDLVFGNWDNDFLKGQEGNDELNGGWGDDLLEGGMGDDRLVGSWGDDLLDGGLGDDELRGGWGNDRFVLRQGDGLDQILDFQNGQDQFLLSGTLTFGQLDIAQVQNNVVITVQNSGEELAVLMNAAATSMSEGDFVTI